MENKRVINMGVLRETLQTRVSVVWDTLAEGYPRLTRFDPPKVLLNNRLWRTGGMAYSEDGNNRIELGTKFFLFSAEYEKTMYDVVLPHEVIHVADFRLNNYKEYHKFFHAKNWQDMMVYYGLPPHANHSMDIPRSFHIKHSKAQ